MDNTVPQPVSERHLKGEADILPFINEEVLPLARQLRTAANQSYSGRFTGTTDGAGTYLALWTSPAMPTNAAWTIRATITGRHSSGTTQSAAYVITALFQSVSSTCTQTGSTDTDVSIESAAAIDARFTLDATARTIAVEARDDAASPMFFAANVEVFEA